MSWTRTLAASSLALLSAVATRADVAGHGPGSVVEKLYKSHFAHEQNFEATEKREWAVFAPALAALLKADAKASAASADEVVGLDFDPLTSSQEAADGYKVGQPRVTGRTAKVPVEIRLGSERSRMTVILVKEPPRPWQISDIEYEEGTLVGNLKELAAARER
jgi:hypothetical protein